MITLLKSALPAPEPALRAALAQYVAALAAHKQTVGVAAPLPAFDLLAAIVNQGGNFAVVDDVPPPCPPPPTAPVNYLAPNLQGVTLTAAMVYPGALNGQPPVNPVFVPPSPPPPYAEPQKGPEFLPPPHPAGYPGAAPVLGPPAGVPSGPPPPPVPLPASFAELFARIDLLTARIAALETH